jgi:hypothetical protein
VVKYVTHTAKPGDKIIQTEAPKKKKAAAKPAPAPDPAPVKKSSVQKS